MSFDPTSRDLHAFESASVADSSLSDRAIRDSDEIAASSDAQRQIRDETIWGMIALACIAAFVFIFFFVIA